MSKLDKLRSSEGRMAKLKRELSEKSAISKEEKEIILNWGYAFYDAGLRDAGDVIGRNIGTAIKNELKKEQKLSEAGRK